MFEIWQCANEKCRFRFPVEDAHDRFQPFPCPRCGTNLRQIRVNYPPPAAETAVSPPKFPLSALLDNIRSIHNVGSMFRTADGAGVAHLYLCGMTATPDHPKLAKAALGAHETVPWSQHNNALDTAVALKEQGQALWAMEATSQARPLFNTTDLDLRHQPTILIVGHEKAGVDPEILALCHQTFSLPMGGYKSSLNAAVAFGIAVYYLQFARRTSERTI